MKKHNVGSSTLIFLMVLIVVLADPSTQGRDDDYPKIGSVEETEIIG